MTSLRFSALFALVRGVCDVNMKFFKNISSGHMSFHGATETPVLDFW